MPQFRVRHINAAVSWADFNLTKIFTSWHRNISSTSLALIRISKKDT